MWNVTKDEMQEILKQHAAWLQPEPGVPAARANLVNTNLRKRNLMNVNLSRAKMNLVRLTAANLTNANLSGANLRNGSLVGATFDRTDLRAACLMNTDLRETDLRGIIVNGPELLDVGTFAYSIIPKRLLSWLSCHRDFGCHGWTYKIVDDDTCANEYERVRWVHEALNNVNHTFCDVAD